MNSQKKVYKTPQINRVKLVVKNAVLASCHDSPVMTPMVGPLGCELASPGSCFDQPIP